jgi:hypothetical protein
MRFSGWKFPCESEKFLFLKKGCLPICRQKLKRETYLHQKPLGAIFRSIEMTSPIQSDATIANREANIWNDPAWLAEPDDTTLGEAD